MLSFLWIEVLDITGSSAFGPSHILTFSLPSMISDELRLEAVPNAFRQTVTRRYLAHPSNVICGSTTLISLQLLRSCWLSVL